MLRFFVSQCYAIAMNALRDMVAYWRRPVFFRQRESLTVLVAAELGRLLMFTLGAAFVLMMVTGLIFQLFNVDRPELSQDFGDMSVKPQFFFVAVITAPIIEELLFRSWMGVQWGVLLVMPFLLWAAAGLIFLSDKTLSFSYDVVFMSGLTALIITYVIYYARTASMEQRHDRAVKQLFPFIFWVTAIVFGLVHMSNFNLEGVSLISLIIILPQLFVGAVLGYVRMHYGLLAAILFHAAYNGVLVGLSLLLTPG